jgi:hypothetical protein
VNSASVAATAGASAADPLAFARSLGTAASAGEVRATHRVRKRRYKKRIRMPSKLDPHLAAIKGWLAAEPQLTALAIARRLAAIDPATFSDKQHSIVQRLLRSLRRKAAETVIVVATQHASTLGPGPVDGARVMGPPLRPQAPLGSLPLNVGRIAIPTTLCRSPPGNICW